MAWNKVRQQLEGLLSPKLIGIVEYKASGYRYTPSKAANSYIAVHKKDVFSDREIIDGITWFSTEQEAKKDEAIRHYITKEAIDALRQSSGGKIPEDRLEVIARGNQLARYAKEVYKGQTNLYKEDFQKMANLFLTSPVDASLEGDVIILNILAIIDRRVGKKRLEKMKDLMKMKHPVVRYFYELRLKGN